MTKKDPYEHIHLATDNLLADMLESKAKAHLKLAKEYRATMKKNGYPECFAKGQEDEAEILFEAARRIRNKPRIEFCRKSLES